ncbi:Dabb family protein [Roseivirga sp.]|uniref:Dabb family protein n=1 Tax=Roseivirga sp. TaxID=1964215 RepID=UPI003B8DCB3F
MKSYPKVLFVCLLVCATLATGCLANYDNESEETITAEKELRHVVLFKFNQDADPQAVKKAEDAFLGLPSKISEIKALEWGLNNSPEGLEKGFTHCYFLTFASEEDRAVYLPHPDHKAFGALLDGILADVLVFDYWANR